MSGGLDRAEGGPLDSSLSLPLVHGPGASCNDDY